MKQLLNTLFNQDETVALIKTYSFKDKPENYRVPTLFLNRDGITEGLYSHYVINPIIKGADTRTDADIAAYRNILIEFDNMDLERQDSYIKSIGLPVTACIYSGGKSNHYIISLEQDVEKHIYQWLTNNIFCITSDSDKTTKKPCQLSRLPGTLRADRMQELAYLNNRIDNNELIAWVQDQLSVVLPNANINRSYVKSKKENINLQYWNLPYYYRIYLKDRSKHAPGTRYMTIRNLALKAAHMGFTKDRIIEIVNHYMCYDGREIDYYMTPIDWAYAQIEKRNQA